MITFLENEKVQGTILENKKVQGEFLFMFFDRYKIHIQAFGDYIYAKCIIFRSSSSQIFINKLGLGDRFRNPEIMEFGVWGL